MALPTPVPFYIYMNVLFLDVIEANEASDFLHVFFGHSC